MIERIAVVTGGLSGIGLESAKALQKSGHKIIIGSRRCGGKQFESVQKILGKNSFFFHLDVGDEKSVKEFTSQIKKNIGDPSILVNAAGIYREAQIKDDNTEHWRDQLDVNLTGPFLMTKELMPGMIDKKFGRIVNIASTAGKVGAAGYAGYCASKAGLIGLSKVTALEGAPYNISCISVSPTWVETPMMDNAALRHSKENDTSQNKAKEDLKKTNPQNRLVQPSEIAALIAFACGENCPALTNEDIQINAGAIW
jgi:NAD(P)-dependent dehydrogenase (short-subunit alcohol dehydrogenase family)